MRIDRCFAIGVVAERGCIGGANRFSVSVYFALVALVMVLSGAGYVMIRALAVGKAVRVASSPRSG